MDREILFRGRTVCGKWWVVGNLTILKKRFDGKDQGYYISGPTGCPFTFSVIPESVGEYTGLRDKNYNMIFEGDILNLSIESSDGFFESKMGRHMKQIGADGVSISLLSTNTLSVSYEATLTKQGIPVSENDFFQLIYQMVKMFGLKNQNVFLSYPIFLRNA